MKKLPAIFTMFFPYLFVLIIYIVVKACPSLFETIGTDSLIVFAVVTLLVSGLFVITVIITAVKMVFKWESKKALLYNLAVKIIYLPVHVALIILALGMGNPFLFAFMFIPVLISLILLGATGIVAVSGIIRGYYEKKYKLVPAIIFGILSFWYVFDIIVAVIAYIKSRKISDISSAYSSC